MKVENFFVRGIVSLSLALVVSCGARPTTNTPSSAPTQAQTKTQPNTVKDLKIRGGILKDGKLTVDPGVKVEAGEQKNSVMLKPVGGMPIKVSCFCVIEGGNCWAVSNPTPGGEVGVSCADQGCSGEPFCFMDINDDAAGFNIRLAVASR